jgi:hypothetical protein
MKGVFLHLIVLAGIVSLAHGQGTIAFGNSALTRIQITGPTMGNTFFVGAFYGPAGSTQEYLAPAPGLATFTTAGVMVNAPSVFALPGTEPGQVVSLQIRVWETVLGSDWESVCRTHGFVAATDVRQVTLAPTAGPGTVIWQTAAGTNPSRFTPLAQPLFPPFRVYINCVPEPSTLALAVLGGVVFLSCRRKAARK